MSAYLLIESRDPFECSEVARTYELATQLRSVGHEVALFLVQNAVLPVRSGCRRTGLDKITGTGIEVLADDFSLRERGIAATALLNGIRPASIDFVVERMAAGWKTIWH
jgi:predicted peroxiredoxin